MNSIDSDIPTENRDLVRLWITRILVLLGGYNELIKEYGFSDDRVANEIGLMPALDCEIEGANQDFSRQKALISLKSIHQSLENQNLKAGYSEVLTNNINRFDNTLHFSETDKKILEFTIVLHIEEVLDNVADYLGDMDFYKVCRTLATVLDINVNDVKNTLKNNGGLSRTGLVYIDHSFNNRLRGQLNIVSRDFAGRMLMPVEDPVHLLEGIIIKCTASELSLDDFFHIQPSIDILIPYLERGLTDTHAGVNILIYGPPGTGKTELSRVIANEINVSLYEIAYGDNEGNPIGANDRLQSYKAAQNILSGHENILVFDEVEEIFCNGSAPFSFRGTANRHKSWINHVLEENSLPTFWLTNSVDGMDSAFLRRFDLIIEVPVPPAKQRKRVTRRYCQSLVSESTIERVATSEYLAPAVVSRASKVVNAIKEEADECKRGKLLEHILDNTLIAQGHPTISVSNKSGLPDYYDPDLINTDIDLVSLADNIGRRRSAKICLYGPPGTGKTAYAQWLANQVGLPLYSKSASDLMSPYVGVTEKKIGKAFRDAESENAVLVIDEIDSFLQDRRNAQRSWEITTVNEMLTQMESFEGIFIASTNLVESLDQASLRRFDIKTKFDYLRPDQSWKLLYGFCEKHKIELIIDIQEQVTQLSVLTPGDFHIMFKRHQFQPFSSCKDIVKALQEECELKEEGKSNHRIGFVY